MKAKFLQLASLLLVATACSQEELRNFGPNETTISAVMEGETRSNATDDGAFTWTKGDQISVYTSSGNFRTFTLNGEGGTATANFKGILLDDETITTCAVYPNSENHKVNGNIFTFNLPAEYGDFETEYVPNTNAPMVALMENSTDFNFKHLGGVLRFKLGNIPAGAAQFVFTATDKDITGNFSVDLTSATPIISAPEKTTANSVTIKFKPLEATQGDMTFFVPLPTGTYSGFSIAILAQDGSPLVDYKHETANTMERKSLARFPKLTFADVNGSLEEGSQQEPGTLVGNVAKLAEAGTLASVLGDKMLTLTSLKVIGEINGTDVKCLRQMLNAPVSIDAINGVFIWPENSALLEELDLSEASIVEGGDAYFTVITDGGTEEFKTTDEELGENMFSMTSLKRIILPNKITTIGAYLFDECWLLNSVIIPDGVTAIGDNAFSNCSSLTSVTIPEGVTAIGAYAFENCI